MPGLIPSMSAPTGNPKALVIPFRNQTRYRLTGVTKVLATGAVLPGCTVEVYETVTATSLCEPHGMLRGVTVSDAAGNFSLDVTGTEGSGLTFKLVGYLAGTPDVVAGSVNTLSGTPT